MCTGIVCELNWIGLHCQVIMRKNAQSHTDTQNKQTENSLANPYTEWRSGWWCILPDYANFGLNINVWIPCQVGAQLMAWFDESTRSLFSIITQWKPWQQGETCQVFHTADEGQMVRHKLCVSLSLSLCVCLSPLYLSSLVYPSSLPLCHPSLWCKVWLELEFFCFFLTLWHV